MNSSHRASGMAVNVGDRLLDYPENGRFQFLGESPEIIGDFQIHSDLAAICKTVQVDAKSRRESYFIQQWRMEQMRNGTHFRIQFVDKAETLLDHLDRIRTDCVGFA